MLDGELAAVEGDVLGEEVKGAGVDGHPAFFVAFADDLEHLLGSEDVGEIEVDQFGYAQTAAIEHFDDDVVAGRSRKAAVEGLLDGVDVGIGEHVGQVVRAVGKLEESGGVVGHGVVGHKHGEE